MTLKLTGRGVHSGRACTVWLHPADGPVRFRRGAVEIPARLAAVVGTDRSTLLGADGVRVGQVEHVLAALHVRGRWRGLVIEASEEELPILDGSAREWLNAIDLLPPPDPAPAALRPRTACTVRRGAASGSVTPGAPALGYTIAFPHPAVGRQGWIGGPADYPALVGCRTFGFASEVAGLRARGLATASSLENAIVFGEEGPLNALRSPDEPVRHKALDALGDMFLVGRPIAARVTFACGSHALHVALMNALLSSTDPQGAEP